MSILNETEIDSIAKRKDFVGIELAISDHLDWDDIDFHLNKLQSKIRNYISFYINKQYIEVFDDLPSDLERCIIHLYLKYESPKEIDIVFESISEQLAEYNIEFIKDVLK